MKMRRWRVRIQHTYTEEIYFDDVVYAEDDKTAVFSALLRLNVDVNVTDLSYRIYSVDGMDELIREIHTIPCPPPTSVLTTTPDETATSATKDTMVHCGMCGEYVSSGVMAVFRLCKCRIPTTSFVDKIETEYEKIVLESRSSEGEDAHGGDIDDAA